MSEWQGSIPSTAVPERFSSERTNLFSTRFSRRSLCLVTMSPMFCFRFARLRHQAHDLERGKMLPGIRCLFHCERGFAFHDESIKILTQKNGYRFGKRPRNVRFDLVYQVENGERFILEDRICIKNKKPGFHNCKVSVE